MASNKAVLGALLALLLLGASPAMAQGPTATPTPYPMPTGAFSELRPVPTPWQVTPQATYDLGGDAKAGAVADSIINGYRYINFGKSEESAGVIDLLIFIALTFLVLQALWSVISSTSSSAEEE
jgi:hypothetical protein